MAVLLHKTALTPKFWFWKVPRSHIQCNVAICENFLYFGFLSLTNSQLLNFLSSFWTMCGTALNYAENLGCTVNYIINCKTKRRLYALTLLPFDANLHGILKYEGECHCTYLFVMQLQIPYSREAVTNINHRLLLNFPSYSSNSTALFFYVMLQNLL